MESCAAESEKAEASAGDCSSSRVSLMCICSLCKSLIYTAMSRRDCDGTLPLRVASPSVGS